MNTDAVDSVSIFVEMTEIFRLRANALRKLAWLVLGLIFVLLLGAAVVFVLARQITATDFSGNIDDRISKLKTQSSIIDSKIFDERKKLDNNINLILSILKTNSTTDKPISSVMITNRQLYGNPSDFIPFIRKSIGNIHGVIDILDLSSGISGVYISTDQLGKIEEAIKNSNMSIMDKSYFDTLSQDEHERSIEENAIDKLNNQKQQDEVNKAAGIATAERAGTTENTSVGGIPLAEVIQTNITRFGTIIMITFLVSILVPLYRYYARLATYYDARADALYLMGTKLKTVGFVRLAGALTPALDFGKSPATPVEQFIELAREVSGARGAAEGSPRKREEE